jgi:hypothetical protein
MRGKITKQDLSKSLIEEIENSTGDVDLSNYTTKEDLQEALTDDSLLTNDKSLVGAINELFQSANNGKQLIADAIGEPLNAEDTFAAMGSGINGLLSTFKTNMMNNGVTIERGDKFKQLIDKIATMSEEGEGKGIQYASGIIENNDNMRTTTINANTVYYIDIPLNFHPSIMVTRGNVNNYSVYIEDYACTYIYDNVRAKSYSIINSINAGVDKYRLFVNVSGGSFADTHWYAIGVGEEDTTLRDSLASILEEEGVEVSEEDDMASLISKVNSELDRKNEEIAAKEEELANSGGLDIISATELPATGKENQICVITDTPFDSVIISTKNDEIYNESNKIILYSVDPRYSIKSTAFNATINNFTYDFHISKIKQGNVNKESYYYRNNIWNELSYTSLPIVKDGAYTNYLGTFTHATNVAGISSDGSGFWLYQGGSSMGSYGLCTSNNTKINFSDYTQIKINLKMNTANKSRTIQFGACSVANVYYNGSNDNTCRTTVGSVKYVSITIKPTDTEYHEYILDISNITGEYYIYAHIPQASDTTKIYYYFKDIEFI